MAKNPTDSTVSVVKDEVQFLVNRVPSKHIHQTPYPPRTDEVNTLARNVFLKFDLFLVLPMLIMFCKC